MIRLKDPRISVRLSKEQHEQLKILVIKRNTNINNFLLEYIVKEIEKENNNENKDK